MAATLKDDAQRKRRRMWMRKRRARMSPDELERKREQWRAWRRKHPLPRKRRKVDDALRATIVRRYADGDTMEQLARALQISRETISAVLRSQGVRIRHSPITDPATISNILDRYERGQSAIYIAFALDIGELTIAATLRRYLGKLRGARRIGTMVVPKPKFVSHLRKP